MNSDLHEHSDYYLDSSNRFVIEDYTGKSPFASLLPGIAGLEGIPMWVFYVNRGQGVCSFGIKDKDKPIMEFMPANKAYQQVELNGFRTFINILGKAGRKYYEPFTSLCKSSGGRRRMYISAAGFAVEETDQELGLKTEVEYFTLPNEPLAALARKVTITNISGEEKSIELLDGMPSVIPYGIDDNGLKQIGNTLKAWMEVYNMENSVPFYKLRAGAEDKEEVEAIAGGHFYLCFEGHGREQLLRPIADPVVVFGCNTALSCPDRFAEEGLEELLKKPQAPSNKVPCGFFGTAKTLASGERLEVYSLIGHVSSVDKLNKIKRKLASAAFISNKREESGKLLRELTNDVYTRTSSPVFDEYCRQTYLDNLLRGGYPLILKGSKGCLAYYVYSRKHGDLERDYNYFVTEPEFYSNGNGNYRDVNQNRCNDVFFHPEIQSDNIQVFMKLIQADGYNPLVITGDKLILSEGCLTTLLGQVAEDSRERFGKLLSRPFTLGRLYEMVMDENSGLYLPRQEFIDLVINESEKTTGAAHGEGFWSDHWVYNLDLIEKYLKVYPDNEKELLFEKKYTYYDNAVVVKKRDDKYLLKEGRVMQLGAVELCKEKEELMAERKSFPDMVRIKHGKGDIYRSSLLAKLVVLAVNRFSCLDPGGMGIEMEAGKPGWNDALNGLPGMFGSSVAESCELLRLMEYIMKACKKYGQEKLELPRELWGLLSELLKAIESFGTFRYWDSTASVRESYRESIRLGFSGEEKELYLHELHGIVRQLHDKLEASINKAMAENDGIYPTYFYYHPAKYERLDDSRANVRVTGFELRRMPLFLEGAVKGMKICRSKAEAGELYQKVKNSRLFDGKLKMYKISEPLNSLSADFGRITAFTGGWFENETVWLHMEYKYMLEVLNIGLYDEFFSDFRNVLVPFLKPELYGRSILENSSFLASSANPDQSIHGKGFVARLSGATAEFLSIWNTMMTGHKPFELQEGKLCLRFKPILPHWLFDENNELSFMFLGKTVVTCHNPGRKSTYLEYMEISAITILYEDGSEISLAGQVIPEPYSLDIRCGKVREIHITIRELHPAAS